MSSYRSLAFIIMCVIVFTAISFSDSPHSNTIPVIAMKTGQDATCEDVTLEFLCELSWNYFDGIARRLGDVGHHADHL